MMTAVDNLCFVCKDGKVARQLPTTCKSNYPLSYLGDAGSLWHVRGGKVVEVRRDCAVIDRLVNRSQGVFYRREIKQEKITLPWVLD